MQCKCGPDMKESTHKVATIEGKKKWTSKVVHGEIVVQQWDCEACGRHMRRVLHNNKVIERFG